MSSSLILSLSSTLIHPITIEHLKFSKTNFMLNGALTIVPPKLYLFLGYTSRYSLCTPINSAGKQEMRPLWDSWKRSWPQVAVTLFGSCRNFGPQGTGRPLASGRKYECSPSHMCPPGVCITTLVPLGILCCQSGGTEFQWRNSQLSRSPLNGLMYSENKTKPAQLALNFGVLIFQRHTSFLYF